MWQPCCEIFRFWQLFCIFVKKSETCLCLFNSLFICYSTFHLSTKAIGWMCRLTLSPISMIFKCVAEVACKYLEIVEIDEEVINLQVHRQSDNWKKLGNEQCFELIKSYFYISLSHLYFVSFLSTIYNNKWFRTKKDSAVRGAGQLLRRPILRR